MWCVEHFTQYEQEQENSTMAGRITFSLASENYAHLAAWSVAFLQLQQHVHSWLARETGSSPCISPKTSTRLRASWRNRFVRLKVPRPSIQPLKQDSVRGMCRPCILTKSSWLPFSLSWVRFVVKPLLGKTGEKHTHRNTGLTSSLTCWQKLISNVFFELIIFWHFDFFMKGDSDYITDTDSLKMVVQGLIFDFFMRATTH